VDIGIAIIALTLLALVVRFVGEPLLARREQPAEGAERQDDGRLQDDGEREALEAAREAKYQEIRDLEMDFRTGKLSTEDYEAVNAQLRSEAIQILDRLEPRGDGDGDCEREGEGGGAERRPDDRAGSAHDAQPGSGENDHLQDDQTAARESGHPDEDGPEGDGVRPRDA